MTGVSSFPLALGKINVYLDASTTAKKMSLVLKGT
jgi:hypothetical protein